MMRKHLLCVIGLFILLSATSVCRAGSVPEDLLSSNDAQIYFGEVKSVDGDSLTVIQRQNIKGEFAQDSEITYPKFLFNSSPEIGKWYLCGYYDEINPLYMWEVTGFNPKTLEIKILSRHDSMAQRMQEYLNDGSFEKKELERLAALKEPVLSSPPAVAATQAAARPSQHVIPIYAERSAVPAFVWILCTALLSGAVVFLRIRKIR